MRFFEKLKEGTEIEKEKEKPSFAKATEGKEKKKKPEPLEKPRLKREEFQSEGQLAIDVYETDGEFVIQSAIAGVKAEDLDIAIENDMVTVRGSRQKTIEEERKKYFYQECYWGEFSRQVILPEEVDAERAEATMKDGILTLRIPKAHKIKVKKIAIKQEE